jgi:hypothetical protein
MGLVAVIEINDVEQRSDLLEVGAFCGTECRGSALATYSPDKDRFMVSFLIFGGNGDELIFKLYDHRIGQELDLDSPSMNFNSGSIAGSNDNPYVLDFYCAQRITLTAGWNWISTYIEGDPVELLDMLKECLSGNGIQIESQSDGLTENIGDGYWWGDLDGVGIMNESMYLIEVASDCTVELYGSIVDPADHEITLYPEWTWIGFPCSEEVDVVVALCSFEAEEGDMIEGQNGVAEYLGDGYWWGIETLVPGQGYMYYSASGEPKTLIIQKGRSKAKAKVGYFGGKAPKVSIERKVEPRD